MNKILTILIFLFSAIAFAQQQVDSDQVTITGKIISGVNNQPLRNGYVIIDMTGTISDKNGLFDLQYKKSEKDSLKKLKLYGMGYKEYDTILNLNQKVPILINVVLQPIFDLNKEMALADIKNGTPRIILSSGDAPVIYKSDKRFSRKYNITFSEYGCEAVANESLYDYNTTVFEYLDEKYGTKWREQIRKDVVGL